MRPHRTLVVAAVAVAAALALAPSAAYADGIAPAVFLPFAILGAAIVGAVVLGIVAVTVLVFLQLRRKNRERPLAPVPSASPDAEPPAAAPGDPDA